MRYGEKLRIYPYSVRIWENADQNNCEYGHFLRCEDENKSLKTKGKQV